MFKLSTRKKGFTLTELLVVVAIAAVLAGLAIPLAKTAVKREKEIELRRNLRTIREAIDAYKKLADENRIETEDDSEGYPPDLETLVKGVEVLVEEGSEEGEKEGGTRDADEDRKKLQKFLRRIPKDPMTNSYDWGLRAYQDDPDSTSWSGDNVYDVYTRSPGTALDGTKYREW
jgi:general secretion pathway protein G